MDSTAVLCNGVETRVAFITIAFKLRNLKVVALLRELLLFFQPSAVVLFVCTATLCAAGIPVALAAFSQGIFPLHFALHSLEILLK